MTPDALARASADEMWRTDRASRALGMQIVSVGPGTAVLTMPVTVNMANGHGICHGGYIFTLADSAFAFACNSYGKVTVAQSNTITYLRPGPVGATLTATAREVARSGRSGLYDVQVTGPDGVAIAEFRGQSRSLDRDILPAPDTTRREER
ncbi:Acyl-coenzyme A thioesterase PaaI [Roseivivax jejudonensis]|uniref:Acyl-coenzyme A thioesterase PaaI n=1 Tax=Roseivivax jejudonensis TaxID=1529041 RepID=A0A1X6Z3X5_9RHOB|nr:hydroxyphenylacetyl-CoA thioesterase PaaI [Roseivivax jejudonensis]SLN40082.1 Acyl-coenzyme A thioesterase PaaI [Roseivivax jejudonensis]